MKLQNNYYYSNVATNASKLRKNDLANYSRPRHLLAKKFQMVVVISEFYCS